jgi:hypothetical protein
VSIGLGLGLVQDPAVARSWSHPGSWDVTFVASAMCDWDPHGTATGPLLSGKGFVNAGVEVRGGGCRASKATPLRSHF